MALREHRRDCRWSALGMTDIHNLRRSRLSGRSRQACDHRYLAGRRETSGTDRQFPSARLSSARRGPVGSYSDFLKKHKDGIFSVVHEVPSRCEHRGIGAHGPEELADTSHFTRRAGDLHALDNGSHRANMFFGLVYWPGGVPSLWSRKRLPLLWFAMAGGGFQLLGRNFLRLLGSSCSTPRHATIRAIAASLSYLRLRWAFNEWALSVLSGFSLNYSSELSWKIS